MSPNRRASAFRLLAAAHRVNAARLEASAAMIEVSAKLQAFTEAASRADLADILTHPDTAYLDLQMDGYYEQGNSPS
jgi:hypothetical protein